MTRPTKITFGGGDLSTIYVTSIAGENPQNDDGRTVALTLGIRGLPEPIVSEKDIT